MENNELTHWGIKGMRWGVRRYQNSDGSLTDAGKKRYDRDIRENKAKKKDSRIEIDGPDTKRWVKEDISRAKKVTDSSSKTIDELKRIEASTRTSSKVKLDLSNMTDQQLRERINRTLLEKQYNDMFAPSPKVSKGREYVQNVLETSGAVLAIGSSALGIALAIKELKG